MSSLVGASDVPTIANIAFVSDVYRFAFCFGANEIGSSALDPMLIRWSDQEDVANWTPEATNQAGSLRLSKGTEIIAAKQARQEILVVTDAAVYGLQYLGAPAVWGAQLVGENTTIISPNAMIYSNNVAYWMGTDKFYYYDGTVKTLPCSVRSYVFDDINKQQFDQVVAVRGGNRVVTKVGVKPRRTAQRAVVPRLLNVVIDHVAVVFIRAKQAMYLPATTNGRRPAACCVTAR